MTQANHAKKPPQNKTIKKVLHLNRLLLEVNLALCGTGVPQGTAPVTHDGFISAKMSKLT